MMKTFGKTVLVALGAATFAAGPALAVTVANQSDKAHEIVVDLGATEPKTRIDAGKSAKLDCPEGCEIRAVGGLSYGVAAAKGDKIVLGKDGMLMHSGAERQASNDKAEKGKSKTMVD